MLLLTVIILFMTHYLIISQFNGINNTDDITAEQADKQSRGLRSGLSPGICIILHIVQCRSVYRRFHTTTYRIPFSKSMLSS